MGIDVEIAVRYGFAKEVTRGVRAKLKEVFKGKGRLTDDVLSGRMSFPDKFPGITFLVKNLYDTPDETLFIYLDSSGIEWQSGDFNSDVGVLPGVNVSEDEAFGELERIAAMFGETANWFYWKMVF